LEQLLGMALAEFQSRVPARTPRSMISANAVTGHAIQQLLLPGSLQYGSWHRPSRRPAGEPRTEDKCKAAWRVAIRKRRPSRR
jgi:hypothetical protein